MKECTFLARHKGKLILLQFEFKLELKHNLWGYLAIFLQLDFLCKSYEKPVYILIVNDMMIINLIYKSLHGLCILLQTGFGFT